MKVICSELETFVQFEFSVFYQQTDGFVVLHEDLAKNAPLDACLEIIKQKGALSEEDYFDICI